MRLRTRSVRESGRTVDIFDSRTSRHGRVPSGRSTFARFACSAQGTLVVLEPTGGYERPLTAALERAGIGYARVNPRQSREFARATGTTRTVGQDRPG